MRLLYLFLLLLCIGMSPAITYGQTTLVKGKVIAADTQEPLIGVSVALKGASSGTVTDIEGQYSINVNPSTAPTLVFSYLGYTTKEVPVQGRSVVDVTLANAESQQLEELVVVGYGVQRKSQVTGAIASISNKDFKDQPVSNLASSIQGRVSGLNVVTPSGTPGAGLLVSVRGANNPLYVVDGIPMLSESNSALSTSFDTDRNATGNGQSVSSISDINPNDIESIEILKDASAAAIYGARAANGVILITTKRGKVGKTAINLNYYTGFQKVARNIEFMNANQMVALIEEARANDLALYNADNTVFGEDFDPTLLTSPLANYDLTNNPNTVWLDEVLRTAPINNYELSLQGGNEKTKFFTSAGYFDQQGIIIENYFRRFNYRVNVDHEVNSRLNIGINSAASVSNNRRSFNDNTYTGTITNALGASPLMPVYEADGSYAAFENYQVNWLSDNPVKSAKEIKPLTTSYRLLATAFAEYKLLENLKFKTSYSRDYTQVVDRQFLSPLTSDAQAVGGEALEANFTSLTWLSENILTWNKNIGAHSFNVLGGVTAQHTKADNSRIVGQGFPAQGLERIASAANIVAATSVGTSFALLSYLGRINYGFRDKYLFTASLRADGSSRFSKDNRFGYFPSASVAWRVSEEDFFNKKGALSALKFRMSYGVTGDQEIGDFTNISFYGPSRYYGTSGIILNNIADPTLSWQVNSIANFGADFEWWHGKVSGSFELFNSRKTKLLSQDIIPGTTGFTSVTRNSGAVENKGVELNIGASLYKTPRFSWDINFNYTYVKNTIKSLTTDDVLVSAYTDLAPTHILKVGEAIGTFWGVKYLGIDPQTGDALFEDKDGNGVIDGDDAQIIGKALPDGFGGLTNTFSFGNFDASLFIRYSYGNEVYNLIRPTYENLGYSNDGGLTSIYANNSTRVLNRWRQPGDNAEYPRASFVAQNYYEGSTQYLEDGSFIRIQNAAIGYTFRNVKWANKIRIYVEGQNLWLFSNYKGFDPEVSSTGGNNPTTAGVDYGAYPQARTLLFGINLGF